MPRKASSLNGLSQAKGKLQRFEFFNFSFFLLDVSQATQCNGFSEESGKVAMYDTIDKADKEKGIAASRRKREVHKRSKEASKTSQQQQVKEDILQSEAPSKKAEKDLYYN